MFGLRWFRMILLGVAALGFPATHSFADDPAFTVLSPGIVAGRVMPETAPGGTVVLRGDHRVNPVSSAPTGRPVGNEPAAPPSLQPGWDRNYTTTGIDWSEYDAGGINRNADRTYDTYGFNRNFDANGLSRPIR